MIVISGNRLEGDALQGRYPENSIQRIVLDTLMSSEKEHKYDSLDQLKFELDLRSAIVSASEQLYKSGMRFKIFRESKCNPDYWKRANDGGFVLKSGVKPSDAINDIFVNGQKYGTECATAMVIVYYKALLDLFGPELFDKTFTEIYLMNWHNIDERLKEIGFMVKVGDFLPGDRRYFMNPDVNPETPHWQGENVIDLSGGLYYGHGIGIRTADVIIKALNQNRKKNAEKTAYLLDTAGRPDFKRLFDIYVKGIPSR